MSATVEWDQKAFLKALGESAAHMDAAAEQIAEQVGKDLARELRAAAPHRTGRLGRSIKSTPGRDAHGPYVDISVDVFYASFVEFGASHTPAEPFFRPTMEKADDLIRSRSVRIRP